jgi:L-seryl-tRNA(Ser) seleniumtransferase/D-glucosaminate-6-phosphate ammonia-lyase
MTALGGSAQRAEVAAAQAAAARAHVDLASLRRAAGQRVAGLAGAQAGCITSGAAAGICIGIASIITGKDTVKVNLLPHVADNRNQVVIQAGHDVNFGAPVTQMIRMGGGNPVVAGTREGVTEKDVRDAVGEQTAAMLYVVSHHCIQENRLSIKKLVDLAAEAHVPLLVDAAAEEDLRRYIQMGADLVTYSGGKAIGGPTVGFLVGRADLIEACELQQYGIARAMKVGKEQIMGLMAALDNYPPETHSREVLDDLQQALGEFKQLELSRVPDRSGRNIERLGIRAVAGPSHIRALVEHLQNGDPGIYTRNHQLDEGLALLDPRELNREDVPLIAARFRDYFEDHEAGVT